MNFKDPGSLSPLGFSVKGQIFGMKIIQYWNQIEFTTISAS